MYEEGKGTTTVRSGKRSEKYERRGEPHTGKIKARSPLHLRELFP